jgi:hypothetical protein
MIDFKDTQTAVWIPACERIEASPQHDILTNARCHSGRQAILGDATPDREEGTKTRARDAAVPVPWVARKRGLRLRAEHHDRKRIVEDRRVIQELMGGAAERHASRRAARAILAHSRR